MSDLPAIEATSSPLRRLTLPLDDDAISSLRAGDRVALNGTIYTARDAAHRRFNDLLLRGEALPIDLRGQVLYYTGPTPAPANRPIGSAGPTTSGRMDSYTPMLMERTGLRATMGKGTRGTEVIEAICRLHGVYFAAVGGTGALLSLQIVRAEVVCYGDLGPEAVHQLRVREFPAVVAIDCQGGNLYDSGPAALRAGPA